MSDSTGCALAIVAQLCVQGVREVVLCPGSRSAPLALALDRAATAGRLRLHVRTDERSAAFLALGLAKVGQNPVAVVTTSGTAAGNLLPAVMEAHHAQVPLLVLTADRPAAQVGFGANQTTEQATLFAGFLRYSARVTSSAPSASWAAQTARAVAAATGVRTRDPGPVHLNVELAEPLVEAASPRPWPEVRPVRHAPLGSWEPLILFADAATVLVCGDASPDTGAVVARLAAAAKVPLIAEPSSNARRGSAALATGRLLVDSDVGRAIERVVVFGHPTLSRPVNRLLSRADVELIVVSETSGWVDPGWRAGQVASAVALEPTDGSWLEAWVAADRHRSLQVAAVLAGTQGLTGQGLAAAVLASQADGLVVLGNSNAIRDADLAPIAERPPAVYANRGLSGIDGLVSTAIGVALGAGRPATLLCGDLTFLHDANGLAAGLGERRPDLRIVVADDDGGSIFATLEYGAPEFAASFERVFATPSGVDLVALASAYGLPARRVSEAGEVAAALARPINGVDVLVVGLDRRNRRDVASRL